MIRLLNRPMEKKHWLVLGFLFLALWVPRLGFFSADAANVCDIASEKPATHNHGAAATTATSLDPQMQIGHCGTLMAVMKSQLETPQISLAEVISTSPPLMSRMAGPSTIPVELHSRPTATRKIYLDFELSCRFFYKCTFVKLILKFIYFLVT